MPIPSDKAFIIGSMIIEANTNGNRVEFYIDDELKHIDNTLPFSWTWNEFAFGTHEIMVKAYDAEENVATDKINVVIFNIGG